jgi:hypothetical protein
MHILPEWSNHQHVQHLSGSNPTNFRRERSPCAAPSSEKGRKWSKLVQNSLSEPLRPLAQLQTPPHPLRTRGLAPRPMSVQLYAERSRFFSQMGAREALCSVLYHHRSCRQRTRQHGDGSRRQHAHSSRITHTKGSRAMPAATLSSRPRQPTARGSTPRQARPGRPRLTHPPPLRRLTRRRLRSSRWA